MNNKNIRKRLYARICIEAFLRWGISTVIFIIVLLIADGPEHIDWTAFGYAEVAMIVLAMLYSMVDAMGERRQLKNAPIIHCVIQKVEYGSNYVKVTLETSYGDTIRIVQWDNILKPQRIFCEGLEVGRNAMCENIDGIWYLMQTAVA